ncbi:deaminase [Mycobacterium sp. AT1]|uniref:deaminase n=1 Tax=Mycobacterium sp. AT1 TaxID=1961706 RepID=UPI0009ADF1C9|nr:deaminase [Mycobacterium sp. AT1]OPX07364.1 hypothetical protein B1790_23635 [Mycobacterium sp. AT1]
MYDDTEIRGWMRMAVDLGKNTETQGDPRIPRVGAVVVKDGEVIGSGYRGMTNPTHHAEFDVLRAISEPELLKGAVVFSTLEPCSRRGATKTPCARRLVEANVGEVHIGIYDPNPVIYREGWKILTDAGITVRDFPADLRDEIAVDNATFLARYKRASGDRGSIRFDHRLNGGSYTVETSIGDFVIHADQGYVYDHKNNVAVVPHATEFAQIDDPSALHFENYYTPMPTGRIACMRSPNGYLLIKRTEGEPRGVNALDFDYEVRGSTTL